MADTKKLSVEKALNKIRADETPKSRSEKHDEVHGAAASHATAAAAPKAATSAVARISVIGDDANGEQYECCKRSEDTTQHDTPPSRLLRKKTATTPAREIDVDQRNAIGCRPLLRGQARSPR